MKDILRTLGMESINAGGGGGRLRRYDDMETVAQDPVDRDCGIANVNIGTSGAEIGGAFGGEFDL